MGEPVTDLATAQRIVDDLKSENARLRTALEQITKRQFCTGCDHENYCNCGQAKWATNQDLAWQISTLALAQAEGTRVMVYQDLGAHTKENPE